MRTPWPATCRVIRPSWSSRILPTQRLSCEGFRSNNGPSARAGETCPNPYAGHHLPLDAAVVGEHAAGRTVVVGVASGEIDRQTIEGQIGSVMDLVHRYRTRKRDENNHRETRHRIFRAVTLQGALG